ncbi:MAG: HD domain-containing protein [Clostridia bacterium]|nr:HD domain-containing protein [Clostridia bacterium]
MKNYIETKILPLYDNNDSGHGIEHIRYVTERCMRFAEQFEKINTDMLYAIAAFHDIAHHIDKKNHETLSAKMFYENEDMKAFFSEGERLIIKEAIEDHRASANHEPRSDYGKIISSADRSTDVDDFLRRTHAYTLKHQPDCTVDEMIERAYLHTKEKYGSEGYAKHYVEDEEYNEFREKINLLLSDKNLFIRSYTLINKNEK